MPDADFLGLVHSLVSTGEAALGNFNPLTTRMNRDGIERSERTAERSLRLLEVLSRKTRGNLDALEADALSQGVQSLRDLLERQRQGLS